MPLSRLFSIQISSPLQQHSFVCVRLGEKLYNIFVLKQKKLSHQKQSAHVKTKMQISCAVTAQLICAFVFTTRMVPSLFYSIDSAS